MKFDIAIANPPYRRNLHLKIVEKVIPHCEEVINISPNTYMGNMGTYLIWNEDGMLDRIIKHIKDTIEIDHRLSNYIFGTTNAIYSLSIQKYESRYNRGNIEIDKIQLSVFNKLFRHRPRLKKKFVLRNELSENGVLVREYVGYYGDAKRDLIAENNTRVRKGIDFKTKEERENFINSIDTWVYNFMGCCGDISPAHLPWMGDYTQPWTDERFRDYFKITDEEWQLIEESMKNINN